MNASAEFSTLLKAGCLMNPDLYGLGIDATIPACRSLIWNQFLKPRCGNKTPLLGEPFFVMKNDQFTKTGAGQTQAKVEKKRFSAGTTIKVSPRIGLTRPMGKAQMPPVMVRETSFLEPFYTKNDRFTMTGSGQTSGNLQKRVAFFAGPWNGYDTSWGPDVAYSNLWVNDWLSIFSDPIAKLGAEPIKGGAVAGHQGWRQQACEFHRKDFFRRIAHRGRIIDHQRVRVNALEKMRRGNIIHVKRRVLAH